MTVCRNRFVAAASAVLFGLTAGGCRENAIDSQATGAAVDYEAGRACAAFTAGYPRATTTARRLALADRVHRFSSGSDNPAIVDRGVALGRSADRGTRPWRAAAAEFRRVCRQAGWTPRR